MNGALKNRAGSCPMSVPPPFWSRGDVKKVTSKLEPEEDVPDPEETTCNGISFLKGDIHQHPHLFQAWL